MIKEEKKKQLENEYKEQNFDHCSWMEFSTIENVQHSFMFVKW